MSRVDYDYDDQIEEENNEDLLNDLASEGEPEEPMDEEMQKEFQADLDEHMGAIKSWDPLGVKERSKSSSNTLKSKEKIIPISSFRAMREMTEENMTFSLRENFKDEKMANITRVSCVMGKNDHFVPMKVNIRGGKVPRSQWELQGQPAKDPNEVVHLALPQRYQTNSEIQMTERVDDASFIKSVKHLSDEKIRKGIHEAGKDYSMMSKNHKLVKLYNNFLKQGHPWQQFAELNGESVRIHNSIIATLQEKAKELRNATTATDMSNLQVVISRMDADAVEGNAFTSTKGLSDDRLGTVDEKLSNPQYIQAFVKFEFIN